MNHIPKDNTNAAIKCNQCGKKELLKFKDIPRSPKGNFILSNPMICPDCWEVAEIYFDVEVEEMATLIVQSN